MNRLLPPLIALALVAGACSSYAASTPSSPQQPVAAMPAGTLRTAWGELPTYRAEGEDLSLPFAFARPKYFRPQELRPGDTAIVDVLVNRDGSIRDVKLQTTSGFDAVDRYVINRFVGAQALLQIAATDPAPYVVRQTFRVGSDGRGSWPVYPLHRVQPVQPGTGQPYWGH